MFIAINKSSRLISSLFWWICAKLTTTPQQCQLTLFLCYYFLVSTHSSRYSTYHSDVFIHNFEHVFVCEEKHSPNEKQKQYQSSEEICVLLVYLPLTLSVYLPDTHKKCFPLRIFSVWPNPQFLMKNFIFCAVWRVTINQ